MTAYENVKILLVEDDPGHARLVEKNLRRACITNEIVILSDGQQAVDHFFGEGAQETDKFEVPVLVLLDLNLPGVDGIEILTRIKTNPRTRTIPVIIVSTTSDEREMRRCYELGCNAFVTKPVDYEEFSNAIKNLGLFLSVVAIPDNKSA